MSQELRIWQRLAFDKCIRVMETGNRDFLVCASPGAGKTRLACSVARRFLDIRHERRGIIIITNSRNLIRAWERTGSAEGLRLKCINSNSELQHLPNDVDGYIATYAALGADPAMHEINAAARTNLVIFDEIHHLEEGDLPRTEPSVWCAAARQAFSNVAFRLALSGTPFRSSGNRIPFIHYEPTEIANEYEMIADYTYSYGEAVAEYVCRRVSFHPYNGPIEYRIEGQDFRVTFNDDLDDIHKSRRLEYFNNPDPRNLLLAGMLSDAVADLNNLRRGADPTAGGLIIAHDKAHARRLKQFLSEQTGEIADIVLSDDEEGDAQAKIETFKTDGRRKWLIAVRMVSEGVDIPRLRVLVYCSRITEELFFVQAMGRIVRTNPDHDPEGVSHMFIPADQRFDAVIAKIEDQIRRAIIEKELADAEKKREQGEKEGEVAEPIREFIGASGEAQNPITGGQVFSDWVLARAQESLPLFPGKTILQVAEIIEGLQPPVAERMRRDPGLSWETENRRLRTLVNDMVKVYANRSGRKHSEIYNEAKGNCRIDPSRSLDSLENAELEALIKELRRIVSGRA